MTPRKALALGTLVVGTLDILDAFIFFGVRGASPIRILQSVAGGLLGREAFQGGTATAALGGVLHFTIAFAIVSVYFLASRPRSRSHAARDRVGHVVRNRRPLRDELRRHPLSAATRGSFSMPVFINGILIHAFGVGLPAALFARAARDERR